MRSSAISLAVIGLALAAILGGYLSGRTGAQPPSFVQLHDRSPDRATRAVLRDASDSVVSDAFSDDDVVVERPVTAAEHWFPERLAFVIGLAGGSAAVAAQFLRLDVPVAFDLDPSAAEARKVAALVKGRGDVLLLHVGHVPSSEALAALRVRFGDIDGLASRDDSGEAELLAGSGLMFFDERGDADPRSFTERGVPLVARDTTVDDRSARTYIAYMLDRAAVRSARQGRLVVFMRPQPHALDALNAFALTRSAQIVTLTAQQ